MSSNNLISNWKIFNSNKEPPYLYPGDDFILDEPDYYYRDFNDYYQNTEIGKLDNKFHLGFIPLPYIGDISNAKIFILMLNPRFNPLGYWTIQEENIKNAMINNLKQERLHGKYPNFSLNPDLILRGENYWISRFKNIITKLAEISKLDYLDTLSVLSKNIAVAQLVPYFSHTFRLPEKIYNRFSSSIDIREYISKRSENKDVKIIILRGEKKWNLKKSDNVITNSSNPRVGYFSDKSCKIIVEHLANEI